MARTRRTALLLAVAAAAALPAVAAASRVSVARIVIGTAEVPAVVVDGSAGTAPGGSPMTTVVPLTLRSATRTLAMLDAASRGSSGLTASGVDREDFVTTNPGDVYVVDGETHQLTNPDDLTPADTPLFNVVGTRIGPTWGEWRSASAVSLAKTHVKKDRTDIHLRFDGLVPGGVYSVFSVTFGPDSRNPLCVSAERGLPLTTQGATNGPDPSSFVAGPDGSATYHGRAEGVLLDADVVQLLLIYHFDGQTYHPLANYGESVTQGDNCRSSYGADAMRQLVIFQKWPG